MPNLEWIANLTEKQAHEQMPDEGQGIFELPDGSTFIVDWGILRYVAAIPDEGTSDFEFSDNRVLSAVTCGLITLKDDKIYRTELADTVDYELSSLPD